ncbi:MAG: hypothetical protein H0V13_03805 [Nocardioidaceae bacterium]|nr:hypothetical protein [Nocardioidaceae bacterium]
MDSLPQYPAAESDPGLAARQLRDARDQASQANLGVLNARYATSLNHLNGEADTTARMLDEGPTEQVIHALTAGGDLPLPPPIVPPLPPFWPDIWWKWLKELEERFFGPPIDWDRSFSDQRWGAIGTYFGIVALVMSRYWGDWLVKGRYGTFQPRGIPPGQVPLLPFRERLRLAQDGDNFPPRPGFEAKQDWWKKFREHTLHGIVVLVGGVAAVGQWQRDTDRPDLSIVHKVIRSATSGLLTAAGLYYGGKIAYTIGAYLGGATGILIRRAFSRGHHRLYQSRALGRARSVISGRVAAAGAGGRIGASIGRMGGTVGLVVGASLLAGAGALFGRTFTDAVAKRRDQFIEDPDSALRVWNDEMKEFLGTDHRRPVLSVLGEGLGVSDRESTHELVSLPPPPSEPVSPPPDNLEQILEQLADNPPAPPPIIVGDGDSLWRIVERRLGPGATGADIQRAVDAIYDANVEAIGIDPDQILPGTQLGVPEAAQ